MAATKYKKNIICGSIGFTILLLGILGIATLPQLFTAILHMKLPLSPGSESFRLWKDIPLPIYFKAYMFHIENPEDILNNQAKPNLTEKGPYTFRLYWTKENITFNPNDTVSFRENSRYVFLRNMSVGDLSENITTLNGPMAISGAIVKDRPFYEKILLSVTLKVLNEHIFINRSVDELLFKGYYDYLNIIGRTIDKDLPDRHGYFSWFYGKNMSNDGLFNINTGKKDITKSNMINSWNGNPSLKFWAAPSCNQINGTNGEMTPPVTKDQKMLYFFRTDLCRSWPLTYERTVSHCDIESKRFIALPPVLANSTVNPDNHCFEPSAFKKSARDLPSGAINISPCQFGAPVVLSQPHFYQGDPILRNNVFGMKPNGSLHSFFLDLEPASGIPLSLAARVQVNVQLTKVEYVSQFNKVPEIIFPVLWQEITAVVTPELADQLKQQLQLPHFIMEISFYLVIGIGLLVTIVAGLWAIYLNSAYKSQSGDSEDKPIVNGADEHNSESE